MLIHISWEPQTEPIVKLRKIAKESVEGWRSVARAYDKVYNNYYDKNSKERRWIQSVRNLLAKTVPEKFQQGYHLIAHRASFMGESIYWHEGHVITTMHQPHNVCGQFEVLHPVQGVFYCAHCKRDIPEAELPPPEV